MSAAVLLVPHWYALKKRWSKELELKGQSGRDLILFIFAITIALALYHGTQVTLSQLRANAALSYLPAGDFLSMFFLVLSIMLLLSSLMTALGTLFLSEDLELVLASPISNWRFFWGKFLYVYFSSAWMPFIFITPVLAAFGNAYQASIGFYWGVLLLMLPWYAIPAALGMSIAMLVVMFMPVYRVREMLLVMLFAFIAALYMIFETLGLRWAAPNSFQELTRIISILTMPGVHWLPSSWFGSGIQSLLQEGGLDWKIYAAQLYSVAVFLMATSYILLAALGSTAYSAAKNRRLKSAGSVGSGLFLRRASLFLEPPFRALFSKEWRLLARDISQAAQVLILIGLALIYIYHLRVFSVVESFPEDVRRWWEHFIFIGNVCMGAFITTAVCTRFVYPSISLEGRAYWVVQASPLSSGDFMRCKFKIWIAPVTLVSALFFASGAFVIGADTTLVFINAVCSIILCYGIVGLAIGIGAIFSSFDWEHSSQLAAGFGSFVFMVLSIMLVFLNMIPAWVLLLTEQLSAYADTYTVRLLAVLTLLPMAGINFAAARIAMRKGEEALETARGR